MSIAFILRMIASTLSGSPYTAHPESINSEIERAKRRATKRIYRAKGRAQDELGNLDKVRITLMSGDMKKFTHEFSQLRNVDFSDCGSLSGLEHFNKERKNWKELEQLSTRAMNILTMGTSLDAIGFGAGVLDQFAMVPEIEGIDAQAEADNEVEALHSVSQRLEVFQHEVKRLCKRMQEIRREAREAEDALLDLSDYFEDGIADIKEIRSTSGDDWRRYSEEQKILIGRTAQIARLIRAISEIRFLTDDADLRPEIKEAIEASEELLDELGA
ncbi:MAG: hypothetical protein SPI25_04770 [Dialister sp.]|nr:hypothetical protein [Dialister sp.]